ncbi:hypothetical protein BJX63DRAFT_323664 [Aspergillus granulosus]|uniref:F-box domain-containing protein n=1 Tax=Aspergillus granulosus TaxID=176169 RepID=A0ABR4H415_9EURO
MILIRMLSELPAELITGILSSLEKADLKRTRLVSKLLASLATPLLFSYITITVEENDLVNIPVENALASSFSSDQNFLHFARGITFTSQYRNNYIKRCPHFGPRRLARSERSSSAGSDEESRAGSEEQEPEDHELEDDDDDSIETRYPDDDLLEGHDLLESEQQDVRKYIPWEYDVENPAGITKIKNRIMAMLIRCREGSLLEFNWDLGICCPYAVLGHDGILARRQQNIEAIRIINDSQCYGHEYWLADFSRLKRLTWIPLTWRSDLEALAMGLKRFAHQLTLLELDIYTYDNKSPNCFTWDTMDLSVNYRKQIFPSLQRLYLCGVPFELAEVEMAHAFNWTTLRSLHLRFCFGWAEFLRQVIASGQRIRLTSLTLEPCSVLEFPGEEVDTICLFLHAFTGLRDLFLSTNETFGTLDIWRAVLNHKDTLKTFVHNQRIPATFWSDDWPDNEWLIEPPRLPFTPQEMEMLIETPTSNPLVSLDLEFLGLSFPSEHLKTLISAFTNKESLQLLHIRQAGGYNHVYHNWGVLPGGRHAATEQLAAFGNWAFGPDGIQSLKGLAFGDFSYGNRWSYIRYMTMVELTRPPLDVKFADALAACPQDDLSARAIDPYL